ncbi:NAD(+)/NADH kinase [Lutispora saccharofermentans]|uniref:NAD kinase n=1 Tax=Lutispora saccharofermentans TaxID=3024236 RepID=A0ABT1NF21_9FIRM|nr:NAD(+)/NADH kinase [Lutispora saccharofermentans]MCQ1529837.1 NAD(+)/NADH kinase [Lutispora saccharofermentans]
MSRIGIIPNLSKDNDLHLTESIAKWLLDNEQEVLLGNSIASRIGKPELGLKNEDIFMNSDFLIVLGGDGTLLNIARQSAYYNVPLFGINLGHLGFLTEVEAEEMFPALEKLIAGEYEIEKRMMLEATVETDNIQLEKSVALNDIGITKGPFARIIRLGIYINDDFVDLYSADGVVISSPTGSTAYSLSAGGPIVSPEVKVMIITPICPHILHSRSIVVSNEDVVKIEVCQNNTEVMLTVDGQQGYKLKAGDVVTIRQAQCHTSLVKLKDRSFFQVLRKKISEKWDSNRKF